MQMTNEMNGAYRTRCDLRVMCGPRYNSFGPAEERREEPGRFFQRAVWKAMTKPAVNDEESDQWDGLE